MSVSVTTARTPSASTHARRPGPIDVVEHQQADEPAVEAGDAGG